MPEQGIIATVTKIKQEVERWQSNRNNKNSKINWQFTTKDAKVKLKTLYPPTINITLAAEIFAGLKKKGQPIGHTDCLIAVITLTNVLQLVKKTTDHFKKVPGLELANWLQ